MRRCPSPRCPNLIQNTARYCTQHAKQYEQQRGTSNQRGYGTKHQTLRTHWDTLIQQDTKPKCSRCDKPIKPNEPFDLDHNDVDRTQWNGPAHQHCNRSIGGTHGANKANPQR